MASASSATFAASAAHAAPARRDVSGTHRRAGVSAPARSARCVSHRVRASGPSDVADARFTATVTETFLSDERADACEETYDTTNTSGVPVDEPSSSGACPYTAMNDALGGFLPTRSKVPPGGPTMLDSSVFFKSLLKAGTSPVGMPEAMLEWVALTGEETVGIKNVVGPLCVSTVDPDIVEYVCHTNAKNYRLRMLPDAFRYVIKNKGITGSDGAYNR